MRITAVSPANERQPFIVVIRSIVVFLAGEKVCCELAKGDTARIATVPAVPV
jgi:hypothetical protein